MGSKGDDRYRSGDSITHVDGRKGTIIRPRGGSHIMVKFEGDATSTTVHVNDLGEPTRCVTPAKS